MKLIELPDECLQCILSRVPIYESIPARLTCKKWNYLMNDDIGYWRAVLMVQFPDSVEFHEEDRSYQFSVYSSFGTGKALALGSRPAIDFVEYMAPGAMRSGWDVRASSGCWFVFLSVHRLVNRPGRRKQSAFVQFSKLLILRESSPMQLSQPKQFHTEMETDS